MKRIVIVLMLCGGTSAGAQMPRVYHHFSFEEVDAVTHQPVANPNGIIEPGEAALVTLSVSFSPPVGTMLDPPWAVHALRMTDFHLLTGFPNDPTGTWHDLQLAPGWDGHAGSPGTNVPGTIWFVRPWQSAEGADQSNPVKRVWQGVWVPDDYAEGTASFGSWCQNIVPEYCSLIWVHDTTAPGVHEQRTTVTVESAVHIPISPDPPPCYPDCDVNGVLNIDDMLCFIDEFAQAMSLPISQQIEHYANCDGSTAAPVLTVNDFICFLDAFAQGCP